MWWSHLEADVLQVVGVALDDLLDEVGVCGLQVGAGGLIELELEAPPELRRVEGPVPAVAHLRGEGPVQQRQVPEDVQQDLLGQQSPVHLLVLRVDPPEPLAELRGPGARPGIVTALLDSFHPDSENTTLEFAKRLITSNIKFLFIHTHIQFVLKIVTCIYLYSYNCIIYNSNNLAPYLGLFSLVYPEQVSSGGFPVGVGSVSVR